MKHLPMAGRATLAALVAVTAVALTRASIAPPPQVAPDSAVADNARLLLETASTMVLLKANAVVGLTGHFDRSGTITSIGVQCAFCHSTVDDSFAPGIGRRLDGWANRDLNVGAIVGLAPDLSAMTTLLGVDEPNPDGTHTRPPKSGSTISRRTARRIKATGRLHCAG